MSSYEICNLWRHEPLAYTYANNYAFMYRSTYIHICIDTAGGVHFSEGGGGAKTQLRRRNSERQIVEAENGAKPKMGAKTQFEAEMRSRNWGRSRKWERRRNSKPKFAKPKMGAKPKNGSEVEIRSRKWERGRNSKPRERAPRDKPRSREAAPSREAEIIEKHGLTRAPCTTKSKGLKRKEERS